MTAPTQKLIVIVGATGAQGGSVLNTFLKDSTYHIRALTRDSTSAKAQALAAKSPNIEVVSADLSDAASLRPAFKDATSIFAVTDWMAIYQTPAVQSHSLKPGESRSQYACTLETQQAQNIFDVASTIPTLERLVFSTLTHISKLSHGKYTHAYHFDSKALAVEYLQSKHPDLWEKTSLINMGAYLENWVTMPLFQPHRDASTGEIVFEMVGSKEGPEHAWPLVATSEDAGVIVKALVDRIPAQTHLGANRALMPLSEFVNIFEKVTNSKARMDYGKSLEGFPEDLQIQFNDTFAAPREFGFYGGDKSVVMPKDVGIELGSVEDWVKKQDWSFALSS